MKATEAKLLGFLKKSPQFVVPIYQRNYSWEAAQCEQLCKDILRSGSNDKTSSHFMGSVVYVERSLSSVSSQEPLLLIDGQQRVTSCTLLIAALADFLEKNQISEVVGGFSAKKLRHYYLLNSEEENERHFKLLLSETDKATLLAILKNAPMPSEPSLRISENYELFQKWIANNQAKLKQICLGLDKLTIVDVALDRSQDNPQLIFESMNATGLALSQADLIRNYLLMGLEPSLQNELYRDYWRKMETAFGQDAYDTHFDAFMRDYLTAKTSQIPNIRQVYETFKSFSSEYFADNVRELMADIHTYAQYYCAIALKQENNPILKTAFDDLKELQANVTYPFLLNVYHRYQHNRLPENEMTQIVRLVENYIFRRAICGMPTNSLNKTFAILSRELDKYPSEISELDKLKTEFFSLSSYRRFPNDAEFVAELHKRDVYHFSRKSYFFRKLENQGRKEKVSIAEYSFEHIMPQNPTLSTQWQAELGENWQQIQQTYLHTLGNLTLTAYNSEYSDRSFAEKRDLADIGFVSSPLKLNEDLGQTNKWNEDAIKKRAKKLAKRAAEIWQDIDLPIEQLQQNQQQKSKNTAYTFESYVSSHETRTIFEHLRREILALDGCVSEEFCKWYIAYKAETNFVDIEPQVRRLKLTLNIHFDEINDPQQLCRDVSCVGIRGNGDVEIGISHIDEIPYVMMLIRQAFDKQMSLQAA